MILIIITVLYVIQAVFLHRGLIRHLPQNIRYQPRVSVIVTARNEAENISACLASLARLNYPRSKLEFIVVNDRSTDTTGDLIREFAGADVRIRQIHLQQTASGLSGKAGALSVAIDQSHGEIIFITDADCIVPPDWVARTVIQFTADVGLVTGFTYVTSAQGGAKLFERIQALDLFYLLTIAAAAANNGFPLSCIGNNFAFRREAYDEVGGYRGVGFSLIEDFALMHEISRNTSWKVIFSRHRDTVVKTKPLATISDFIVQRKRWATGSFDVHNYGKMLIGLGVFSHLYFVLYPIFTGLSVLFISCLSLIICSDLLLLSASLRNINHTKILRFYLPFKLFAVFYYLLLPLALLVNRRIIWKEIDYPVQFK